MEGGIASWEVAPPSATQARRSMPQHSPVTQEEPLTAGSQSEQGSPTPSRHSDRQTVGDKAAAEVEETVLLDRLFAVIIQLKKGSADKVTASQRLVIASANLLEVVLGRSVSQKAIYTPDRYSSLYEANPRPCVARRAATEERADESGDTETDGGNSQSRVSRSTLRQAEPRKPTKGSKPAETAKPIAIQNNISKVAGQGANCAEQTDRTDDREKARTTTTQSRAAANKAGKATEATSATQETFLSTALAIPSTMSSLEKAVGHLSERYRAQYGADQDGLEPLREDWYALADLLFVRIFDERCKRQLRDVIEQHNAEIAAHEGRKQASKLSKTIPQEQQQAGEGVPDLARFIKDWGLVREQEASQLAESVQELLRINQFRTRDTGLPDIIRTESEPQHFCFPDPHSNPVPFLEDAADDGCKCPLPRGAWLGRRPHPQQTRRKPGNDGHTLPYEQGVRCQQFFRSGAASSWFEVLRRVSTSPWLDVAGPNTTDAETNPRLQAPQQGARAEDQEGQEVQGSKAADTPSQAQPPARATSEHEIITQIRQEEKAEQARLVRIEDATAKAANLWRPERARQAESGPGRDDKASAPSPLSWLFPRATKRQRPGSDQEDNPGRSDNNTAEGPTINSTSQAAKRTRQGRTASSAAGDQEGAWSSTSPWAQPDERASLSQCRYEPTWRINLPFMPRPSGPRGANAAEPWRQVLSYIRQTEGTRNHHFGRPSRFLPIQAMFYRWKTTDCQLCFSIAGQVRSDHGLDNCQKHGRSGVVARVVLEWLDEAGPHGPGRCQSCLCIETPCQDIVAKNMLAPTRYCTKEEREFWRRKLFDPLLGVDRLCQNRPIIKRTIAALWAWEDGVLAKALMAFMQQSEGIDLLEERQVRAWFEKMVPETIYVIKTTRLLFIFEFMVVGFDFWRQQGACIDG
ncbi:hypothetical protein CSUB01_11688 [Colletotrichum sublineola]|uniref:Uncharacterized protein n=1 Tax=Colletotrichum sublineola TaxID=1173701 RepID=A0A066XLP9_COLSU|nr:hypothetical protein CSUB01_11688 [Colletotrichum sublineola]